LVALATPGCATKKYVRTQVGTVDQRVSDVDKKQTEALASLDGKEQKDVSRVEERAMSAENKANDAARAAQVADQKATQADQTARNANDLAQQDQARIGDVQHAVADIDKFKLVSSEDVLFGFGKATLTEDGKAKLDSLLQSSQSAPRYVVEVEGFTDRTGPQEYNLALSRRRADAVVRYMVDHGIPLRNIHMIGLGEVTKTNMMAASGQAATAGTEEHKLTRKEMRRVVINLYQPETPLSASANAPQSQPMNQPDMQSQPTTTSSDAQAAPSPR
jgi:outer membrane protein OmpA-like peptidoglycan-associated protein